MAGISTGQSDGKKRSVDHEIPLIPFIDLLLCCVMFLLVTAVWNKLATVDANVNSPDPHGPIDRPPPPEPLTVRIEATGYTVSTAVGDRTHIPVLAPARYDVLALHTHLAAQRNLAPREHAAALAADDGVHYSEVVETMDVLAGSGFSNVTVTGSL